MTQIETATSGNGEGVASDSLRDQIAAALREQDETDFDSAEGLDSEPSEPESEASAGRIRDAQGRFAKAEAEQKQVSKSPSVDPVQTEQALPAIGLPKSWAAEHAERFTALPRELQEYVAKRELDRDRAIHQSTQETAKYRQFVEPLQGELAKHRDVLSTFDKPVHESLGILLNAQRLLDSDPKQAIAKLAESYGLQVQIQGDPKTRPQQFYDPRVDELINYHQEQRQREADRELQSLESEVTKFATEKDSSGNPLRPHFDSVWEDMAAYIKPLQVRHPDKSNQEILDLSYKAAISVNPAIAQVSAQADEQKRIADAKARAANAKRAGSSLSSGNAGGSTSSPNLGTLRDVIKAAYRGEIK